MAARYEITKKYAQAYADAPKKSKSVILDQVVEITGWNRDHARQQLRARHIQPRQNQQRPSSRVPPERHRPSLLGVMSSQVVQSRDRWLLPDRGVGPVVIVDVDPAGQGCEAVGF